MKINTFVRRKFCGEKIKIKRNGDIWLWSVDFWKYAGHVDSFRESYNRENN